VNMKQHSLQRPAVGGIYRDKSGSSLMVVNIVGKEILLEYANGAVTTIDKNNWYLLQPRPALF
jgi:hypothetical protein